MNKKEVLDAMSQEFRKSLQDIDATNGEVIKAMFPNCYCKHGQDINDLKGDFVTIVLAECGGYIACQVDWWNASYKGVEE